jgi:hypothetical protein
VYAAERQGKWQGSELASHPDASTGDEAKKDIGN